MIGRIVAAVPDDAPKYSSEPHQLTWRESIVVIPFIGASIVGLALSIIIPIAFALGALYAIVRFIKWAWAA